MRRPACEPILHLKSHFVLCLVLSSAASVSAQISNSSGTPNERANVSGTVVNSETNEPVARALVQLGPYNAMSDDKGHFNFDSVPTMSTTVYAEKPGYFGDTQLRSQLRLQGMIQVAAGMAPLIVKLVPEGIISGQVTSQDGEPLDSIPIELITSVINDGIRVWQQRGGTQTDDEGRFRISELQPGTYYLSAGPSRGNFIPPAVATSAVQRQQGYAKAYFPSGRDVASASPFVITPGNHIEADFTLAQLPTYRITGSLSGFAENQSINVQIIGSSGMPSGGMAVNPRTGVFASGFLPADSYTIRAYARSMATPQRLDYAEILEASTTINLSSDISGLHLVLSPQRSIPIKTKVDWAAQPQNVNFQPVTVQFWPDESAPGVRQMRGSMAMLGPGGPREMAIRDVEPGRYWVDLRPNGPLYVASATYGDVDLLREDIVIGAEIGSQPIEVELRDDGGNINATVTGTDAQPRGVVFYVCEEVPRRVYMSIINNRGSAFGASVAPGTYKVIALDDADGIEYRRREALQEFMSGAGEVTVGPKGQVSVTVQLTHREK